MDNATKKVMNRPSFELEYENGKPYSTTYNEIEEKIERAYEQQKMTRREMNEMKSLNNQIYDEYMRG